MEKSEFEWVRQARMAAENAPPLDLSAEREKVISASERIVGNIARKYRYDKEATEYINRTIQQHIAEYNFLPGIDYVLQLHQVAVGQFKAFIDFSEQAINQSGAKGIRDACNRLILEYELALQKALGI